VIDPTRREILRRLRRDRRTADEIAGEFSYQPPGDRGGSIRSCHLNAKRLRAVGHWLRDSEAYWGQMLRNLKKLRDGQAMNRTTASTSPFQEIAIQAPAE
jgi:hypothetical protein